MIKRLTYFISVLVVPSITLAYNIYITTPTTSVSYNTGETVVLEWTTDAPGVYGSIALYQGMDINNLTLIQTIESNFYFTSGSQSHSWTIPSSVSTGSDYRIQFTIGAQSFNSSFFSINNTGSGSYSTIAAARAQGIGASVTVRGVVTTPNYTSSSGIACAMQDGTAGIAIYSPSISNFLAVGDSLQVSGTRQEYNNKMQIWPGSAADITVISQNNPLPDFQVVTVANFLANGEDYESELIRINSVSITSGTWPTSSSASLTISDDGGTSTVIMHIDSDMDIIGNPEPSSPFDVQGDAGQYYDDYQLRPRYYTDFNPTSSSSGDDDGSIELLTGYSEYGVSQNEQGYPLNSFYHDVKHQSLYWASDLADAGILSGSSITGIKLKVNQTPGMNLDSVRIAYSWTSNTEFSSFNTTTTVVHGPTNYYAGDFLPNNWVQFNLVCQ